MGILNFLPEDPDKKAAARQGLLQFGAAMLNGRGNFGQALGQGLQAGSDGYYSALQQAQKDQLEAAQLKLLQGKDKRAQALQDTISSAFGAPQPPISGSAQTMPVGAQSDGGIAPPIQSAPRPQGAAFPLNLNQVSAIKAMGGPDLSNEYKMANEGFKRDQGATYIMPDGSQRAYAKLDNGQIQGADGSVSTANGYNDAIAATEAAKAAAVEKAKASYDLVDPTKFVGADGTPILNTRAGVISDIGRLPQRGAAPAALPPVRPAAASPANFPVVTPQQQKARDGTRLEILQQERAKATDPRDIAALDREIAGAGGAPVLQSAAQAKSQLGAVDTTLKAGQGLNDNWIKEVHNPVQAEGKAARTTLNQLETIKNVNFQTGWGAEAKAGAANILASLGVKDAEKYAGNAQKFQQVAMERNMTQLAAQAGPQTEGDSQRAQQTFLKLANTPAANQFIADLTGANARIAAMKADYYNKALPMARQTGDLTEIDRRWAKIAPSVWSDPKLAKYKAK